MKTKIISGNVVATLSSRQGDAQVVRTAPGEFTLLHPWGDFPFAGTISEARAELRKIIDRNEYDELAPLAVIGSKWTNKGTGNEVEVVNLWESCGKQVSFTSPNSKVTHAASLANFVRRYEPVE